MKHNDENIRELFSQKLGQSESPVAPHIWQAVNSHITGSSAGAVGTVVAGKMISVKILVAALSVAIVAATGIYFVVKKELAEKTIPVPANSNGQNQIEQVVVAPDENSLTIAPAQTDALSNSPIKENKATTAIQEQQNEFNNKNTASVYQLEDIQAVEQPKIDDSGRHTDKPITMESESQKISESEMPENSENWNANFSLVCVRQQDLRYFFIPQTTNASRYEWNLGDGEISAQMSPAYAYDSEGEYTVALTTWNANGESKTTSQIVQAYKPAHLLMPNIFSPDGDGLNDLFLPKEASTGVTLTRMLVMQNGKTIFESNGDRSWDGTDRDGNNCAPGLYQYVVSAQDKNAVGFQLSGDVTLRR